MSQVFVYATLKSRNLLEKTIGADHAKAFRKAKLSGYRETEAAYRGDTWPTLVKTAGQTAAVPGDVFDATEDDLKKLDKWEDHYTRKTVETSEGEAFVYVFLRPDARAAFKEAKWRSE